LKHFNINLGEKVEKDIKDMIYDFIVCFAYVFLMRTKEKLEMVISVEEMINFIKDKEVNFVNDFFNQI